MSGKQIRVFVCGNGASVSERLIDEVLLDAKHLYGMSVLVHEDGAGEVFVRWARKNGVEPVSHPSPGPRLELMIAFPGTSEYLKRRARSAGVDILEVWDEPGQGG